MHGCHRERGATLHRNLGCGSRVLGFERLGSALRGSNLRSIPMNRELRVLVLFQIRVNVIFKLGQIRTPPTFWITVIYVPRHCLVFASSIIFPATAS
jgi:hypothetical protein